VVHVALLWLGCSQDQVSTGLAPPPALREPDKLRLLALGDAGKGNDGQRQVAAGARALCAREGCDLVVLLGDNLYPKGMESPDDPRIDRVITEMYADIGAPIYLVLGNHDYGSGRDKERARWQVAWAREQKDVVMPSQAWRTDAGPARLIGLDTNAVMQFGGDFQQRWLREQLTSSDAVWNVVFGHHPYRSDGPHGNAGSYEGTQELPMLSGSPLRTLFDEELCGQADLYLSGHEHVRELISYCETQLVISGAGASATRIVDRGNDPWFARASLGMAWLELGPDSGVVRFADANGQWDSELFPITPK
jgi:tartrate-resistant acid phosphatase type 5